MKAGSLKRWAVRLLMRLNKPYYASQQRLVAATAEVERLRAKLVAANQSSADAGKRADELRREKERLRARVRRLTSALREQRIMHEQMSAKMTVLRDELERLGAD